MPVQPRLVVASNKDTVPAHLNSAIVQASQSAIQARGVFTMALSGGSLPTFLSTIQEIFAAEGITDPKYDCWHVLLADERCVPLSHDDSNLGLIQKTFLSKVSIPEDQVYGIDESLLEGPTESMASDYELKLKKVLALSGNQLDLAVLGFGPDGHTCSLFPDHSLLKEETKLVASIDDSPKPPPKRITLTFPVLNTMTRNVVICGAGESKAPILKNVIATAKISSQAYKVSDGSLYDITYQSPPPYPSSMVKPVSNGDENTLVWIVDADAVKGISLDSN